MQKENGNKKVIPNLIWNLQRKVVSQRQRQRQAWKILNQVQDDNTNFTSGLPLTYHGNGFTLIELLVVVLIIGILAAVAVPQYQFAVDKSRFVGYRALANSLAQSAEAYYLANGSWPTSFDDFVTELPADMSTQNNVSGGLCRKNNKIFCCMIIQSSATRGSIRCGDADYHLIYTRWYAGQDNAPFYSQSCGAKEEKYKAICKAISGGKNGEELSEVIPDGWVDGYFQYYY